jgi:hypothetical protein
MPNDKVSSFTDADGAQILIDTDLVEHLYELWQFEKSRRGIKV